MSDNNMPMGQDTHDHDMTYENEQSMVTIPLREYDKLKAQGQYITDPSLISIIDKRLSSTDIPLKIDASWGR